LQFKTSLSKNLTSLISTNKLGMIAPACHPSYTGDKSRQITVQVILDKKLETLSETGIGVWLKW
jgi:hypothetical protein